MNRKSKLFANNEQTNEKLSDFVFTPQKMASVSFKINDNLIYIYFIYVNVSSEIFFSKHKSSILPSESLDLDFVMIFSVHRAKIVEFTTIVCHHFVSKL